MNNGTEGPSWSNLTEGYMRDLKKRGAAKRTISSYMVDLKQLTVWFEGQSIGPLDVDHKILRHYAAHLSDRGCNRQTVARKLSSIRTFYSHLIEREQIEHNPADLVSGPVGIRNLPRVLKQAEVEALIDRVPATDPLDMRDRALFELILKINSDQLSDY